ncbi:MAG: transcriptional regulator [Comamonadaceae bacterium CG_4_9_14_0_8_um_filter_57_21]|nr:MAG: transcriptional regulator [Comamonadaceae bacterium CG_4_10_14_0_8_um_filter_57_29]PJC18889.1 MAG: transcriptional regulator [Comamonadaceae bacterium CG_4_9_14_0_8_um_filter_57_21]
MKKQVKTSLSARGRLARNLRLLRARYGLSQEALADLVDLHRTYVGSIERSERNVSLDNVEKLATALKIDICELLSESLTLDQNRVSG